MSIPAFAKKVPILGQTMPEPVHFKIKASPQAAKEMDDLAKSLGTTATTLISSGIDVDYEP